MRWVETWPGLQVMCFLDATYERFFGWRFGRSFLMSKQLVVDGMRMSSGLPESYS